jgi:hypothetical protein
MSKALTTAATVASKGMAANCFQDGALMRLAPVPAAYQDTDGAQMEMAYGWPLPGFLKLY